MSLLLDTNIVSDLRRPHLNQPLAAWARQFEEIQTHISVITLFEIRYGALALSRRDPAQAGILERWLEESVLRDFEGRILDLTAEIALTCAALHVPNKRGERDAYIAATALVHDLTLVTRNTRDFDGLGLKLVNPWID